MKTSPRKLSLEEYEIQAKQVADIIFNNFWKDATDKIAVLRITGSDSGIYPDDMARVTDIMALSILSSFIVNAVHPLGRDKFLRDLATVVKQWEIANSKLIEGKVHVQ